LNDLSRPVGYTTMPCPASVIL